MSDVAPDIKREPGGEHSGPGVLGGASGPGPAADGLPSKGEQVEALLSLAEFDARLRQEEAPVEGAAEKPSAQRRRRDDLGLQRSQVAQTLPAEVLALYELAVRSGREPLLAKLVAGVCSGCYLQLATSLAQRVRKSRYVSACPYCRRLLYEVPEAQPTPRPGRSRK